MKKTSKLVALLLTLTLAATTLVGCGAKTLEGSATVDLMTTAGNSCVQAQVSSMLGITTELSLKVENGTYTFTKKLVAPDGEDGTKGTNVTFTFNGTAQVDGDTATLEPATAVSYDIQWGDAIDSLAELGLKPTENGVGSDAAYLNWFYTPYLKDNGANTNSMKVTVKEGQLSFEGFALAEED